MIYLEYILTVVTTTFKRQLLLLGSALYWTGMDNMFNIQRQAARHQPPERKGNIVPTQHLTATATPSGNMASHFNDAHITTLFFGTVFFCTAELIAMHTLLLQRSYLGQNCDSLWKRQLIQENKNEWLWWMKEKPFPVETAVTVHCMYLALNVFNHTAIQ